MKGSVKCGNEMVRVRFLLSSRPRRLTRVEGRVRRGAAARRMEEEEERWRRRSRGSGSPPQSTLTPFGRSTRSSEVKH